MKSFPIYLQHDTMDCGPSCLRMIASYYGKLYSLESLRELCYVSREGVSLRGISEAAEKIGFHTIGLQITFDQLCNEITLPCILYWNQEHFVVLYKIQKKKSLKFYIADPSVGLIVYSEEEFILSWINNRANKTSTGVILSIKPTPSFYQEEVKEKKNSFLFLLSYIKPYKKLIAQLTIGLITGSLLQLILPFLTQAIVDFGILNQNISFIYLILIAQLVLVISSTSVEFIRGWILLHLGTRVNISLISDYLIKLMKLPISFFDTKMTGDIIQRINDHSRIQDFLTNSTLNSLFSFFNIIILGGVILIYNWQIFLIFFLGSGLYILWMWLFMKRRAELDHKSFAQNSANQSNIIQLISGMQDVKLNTCEQQKRWDWENIQVILFKLNVKGLTLAQYQESGGILINQIKNILITAVVANFVIQGKITLGMMLAIQYIIGQLNSPIDQLIHFFRQSQDAKLSLERLQEVQYMDNEEKDTHQIDNIPDCSDILIKSLSFKYDKLSTRPILSDINLHIPYGKMTAIVGMSGSGKTTLIKLLLGFYPADSGEIQLNTTNIQNINIREWRKKCGVVMQDGYIFSDTIAKNIAPGVERIDPKKMQYAVNIANIKDFIDELPLRYNTIIGTEGHGLSQGQKQRILIARAIYKNPEYIFLDEATNSLDANNEKSIMSNLNSFLSGKTSVIVAHRLSTVKNADQIVVLQHGIIVEVGKHNELIENKGYYYDLVKNQLNV